jgi:hypothetical protein
MPRNNSKQRRRERTLAAVDRMREFVTSGNAKRRGRNEAHIMSEADRIEQEAIRR